MKLYHVVFGAAGLLIVLLVLVDVVGNSHGESAAGPRVAATPTHAKMVKKAGSAPRPRTKAGARPSAGTARVALTGFGATTAEWNAAHREAPWGAPGAAYDPDPTLPQVDGHDGVRYFAVLHIQGRVLDYSMALNPGTTQLEAGLLVKREFPRDVRVLWTARKDTCLQLEVASATLARDLSDPAIGDPAGEAFVELDSDDATGGNPSYAASDVREALLGLGSYATPGAAPGC